MFAGVFLRSHTHPVYKTNDLHALTDLSLSPSQPMFAFSTLLHESGVRCFRWEIAMCGSRLNAPQELMCDTWGDDYAVFSMCPRCVVGGGGVGGGKVKR